MAAKLSKKAPRADYRQFVAERVVPALAETALKAMELIAAEAPELEAGMRGGTDKYIPVPVWRLKRDVIILSPSKKGITLSFANGALFDDPERLLGGAGKTSRTVVLKSVAEVERPALAALVRQARDVAVAG